MNIPDITSYTNVLGSKSMVFYYAISPLKLVTKIQNSLIPQGVLVLKLLLLKKKKKVTAQAVYLNRGKNHFCKTSNTVIIILF